LNYSIKRAKTGIRMSKDNIIDAVVASGAISTPMWLVVVHDLLSLVLVAGGIALVALRIVISYNKWRNPE
tara:strand:+ start:184 stop:393 length:210 start_codon:yes stop_codon:yes gene_type:complete